MNVYISSYEYALAREVAAHLVGAGHAVTANWLGEKPKRTADRPEDERVGKSVANIDAVRGSDALVLITSEDNCPGGNLVEAGAALGLGKPVVLIGRRPNLLLWHPLVTPTTPGGVTHALALLAHGG